MGERGHREVQGLFSEDQRPVRLEENTDRVTELNPNFSSENRRRSFMKTSGFCGKLI